MEKSDLDRYNLTTAALAAKIQYHPQYVRFLAASGKLPAIKRGRAWLFCADEVFQHLKLETEKNVNGSSEGDNLLR